MFCGGYWVSIGGVYLVGFVECLMAGILLVLNVCIWKGFIAGFFAGIG